MTYCDLCGRAIPTVNPVRVLRPLLKFAYPEGVWAGLCENCLESADKTRVKVEKEIFTGTSDKCDLCGSKTDLYAAEMHIPDFSKEIVKKDAML
ncbi:F420H2 dehydrogenase subunit FpoO [Methanosarcina sp. KYL-1]|uniref:F420H2 dehydrogenase subunit FpoO n=1 Tax=Methanosarcina sp. KYL-1 TaxID=2602068 RepID=UPI0021019BF3